MELFFLDKDKIFSGTNTPHLPNLSAKTSEGLDVIDKLEVNKDMMLHAHNEDNDHC